MIGVSVLIKYFHILVFESWDIFIWDWDRVSGDARSGAFYVIGGGRVIPERR